MFKRQRARIVIRHVYICSKLSEQRANIWTTEKSVTEIPVISRVGRHYGKVKIVVFFIAPKNLRCSRSLRFSCILLRT